jgi:hypothetical protein
MKDLALPSLNFLEFDLPQYTPGVSDFDRSAGAMPMLPIIEQSAASNEVRAVYEDIKVAGRSTRINDFWKMLASRPPTLRRMWDSVKAVRQAGALDQLTKETIDVAVSVTNNCENCIA